MFYVIIFIETKSKMHVIVIDYMLSKNKQGGFQTKLNNVELKV